MGDGLDVKPTHQGTAQHGNATVSGATYSTNGVPSGVSGDLKGGLSPFGIQIPRLEGSRRATVGGVPLSAGGMLGVDGHANFGLAPDADGVNTLGLNASVNGPKVNLGVGPVSAEGTLGEAHADGSINENGVKVGAGASLISGEAEYDGGDRRASIGAGVGVGADAALHYGRNPNGDGKRLFGAGFDVDVGPGIHLDYQTEHPISDLSSVANMMNPLGGVTNWAMDRMGLGNYSPAGMARRADGFLQSLIP